MTRVYYKEAAGAIIVFDVSQPASFDAVLKWKSDLDAKVSYQDGSPIPALLLANKCDEVRVAPVGGDKFLDRFCEENGFIGWFYTSPKENINIEEACNFLIRNIMNRRRALSITETSGVIDGSLFSYEDELNRQTSRLKQQGSSCC